MSILEIAVDSVADARAAAPFGDRLEVCRDLHLDGLTPSASLVGEARRAADQAGKRCTVVALIRPDPGLAMTPAQAALAEREILEAIDAGAHAVAFGALDALGQIDRDTCAGLLRACGSTPAVFHRAFDFARDVDTALDTLVELGFARLLTAGVASFDQSAASLDTRLLRIHATVERAAGRIGVVACGGVRAENIARFGALTPEVHSSCRISGQFDCTEAARLRAALGGA